MSQLPARTTNNTQTVARNTLWYGTEVFLSFAMSFWTSVAIARAIGPERLGEFNFLSWLTTIANVVGGWGVPVAARKYMAEMLGRGEEGLASTIFFVTLRIQIISALCLSAAGLIVVFAFADQANVTLAAILVCAMAPRMITQLPSEANAAAENMAGNTPASLIAGALQTISVGLSLYFKWGLIGVAAGWSVAYWVELCIKLAVVLRWVRPLPRAPLPAELKRKLMSFSGQGLIMLLLNVVVWDRSDMIFLKALSKSASQITFFSLSFNLTDKLLMLPNVFSGGLSVSVMSQYGRDSKKLFRMVPAAAEYMLLCALPILLGGVAVAPVAIRLCYGAAYEPLIPVFVVAALFAIPKALMGPVQRLLQANERQSVIIWCTCCCAVVNVALDYLLVPVHGAMGAAIANGTAQALAVAALWAYSAGVFPLEWRPALIGKVALCSGVMACAAFSVALAIPNWFGLFFAVVFGAAVLLVMLRLTRTLADEDRGRLEQLGKVLPARFSVLFMRCTIALAPVPNRGLLKPVTVKEGAR